MPSGFGTAASLTRGFLAIAEAIFICYTSDAIRSQ